MLWLERPPWLRWCGAALLVAIALWSELSPPATTTITVLADDVPAGSPLEERHVERRRVPAGAVETVEPGGVAAVDLKAGDPLVASMVAEVRVPDGWMVIEAPVPSHARLGSPATGVIVSDGSAPVEVPAIVTGLGSDDGFGEAVGTLAVPAEWMAAAAVAATRGELVVGVGEAPG